ncbi:putative transcriptional regulator, ModE family [Methanosalsum zhilinae DSM 4017]|uniref:Putative transcriptional regulator, ModE family n=1 Tax=Methanosalsum zhilinae (strain DSM 4017 / NBRC 107636 / OCM 62 / WeN5) TaxID=679901 RepID=F7XQL9_METZD|nr:TOBE domain-containing protein [Methanosalsum zhilinae]AEH61618.1 putative transcriptional regulator, ModE family [Methanosalsum zhilinae DSM 4017]
MDAKTKVWLNRNGKPIMGEGKARLLQAIDEEGSLNKACKRTNISYKHAWNMIRSIEDNSGEKVVTTVRGGKNQGTFLTECARKLLNEYESCKNMAHETVEDDTFWEGVGLRITARNQIPGEVIEIDSGDVISKVKIAIDPSLITSVVTREAVDKLDIKKGDKVYAVIKSTEVMLAKEVKDSRPSI